MPVGVSSQQNRIWNMEWNEATVQNGRGVATIEATEAAASPKKYYQAQLAALHNSIISLYCLYLGLFKCPYYNVVNGLTYVCNLDFNSRSRIAR